MNLHWYLDGSIAVYETFICHMLHRLACMNVIRMDFMKDIFSWTKLVVMCRPT